MLGNRYKKTFPFITAFFFIPLFPGIESPLRAPTFVKPNLKHKLAGLNIPEKPWLIKSTYLKSMSEGPRRTHLGDLYFVETICQEKLQILAAEIVQWAENSHLILAHVCAF